MTADDVATDCDKCRTPILYGVTCYSVPTGRVWDGDDIDRGKPVVEIWCAGCYGNGPLVGQSPVTATREGDI